MRSTLAVLILLLGACVACLAGEPIVDPPTHPVPLGTEFGSSLTYKGAVSCQIGGSVEFNGKEITVYPVTAFQGAEITRWEGSRVDNADVINRNCLITYGQEIARFNAQESKVYVTTQSIDNCFATVVDGVPIVVVDPFFLRRVTDTVCDRLYALRESRFAGLAPEDSSYMDGRVGRANDDDARGVRDLVQDVILRHEFAHQSLGHTQSDKEGSQHPPVFRELCADASAAYWIGWYRKKDYPKGIASDVQIAQAICVEIESSIGGLYDSTHPSAMRRMTMVREFYARGSNDHDADKKDAPSAETVAEYLGDTSMLKPSASIERVWVDHNVVQGGATGMLIHVRFSVKRMRGESGTVAAYFYFSSGKCLRDSDGKFTTADGSVSVAKEYEPQYDKALFEDLTIFMPVDQLHLASGHHDLCFHVQVFSSKDRGQESMASSDDVGFQVNKR